MAALYFSAMHPGVWEEKGSNGAAARGKKIPGGGEQKWRGGDSLFGNTGGGLLRGAGFTDF